MTTLWLAFFVGVGLLQAGGMLIDEFYFHRRRAPLPRWELWGHPADTLSVVAVYTFGCAVPYAEARIPVFLALAVFSSLLVTKDEAVHARLCVAGEHFLHAFLFLAHPLLFVFTFLAWRDGGIARTVLTGELGATALFGVYQFSQLLRATHIGRAA